MGASRKFGRAAGAETIILPRTVEPEVEELQAELRRGLDIVYVEN